MDHYSGPELLKLKSPIFQVNSLIMSEPCFICDDKLENQPMCFLECKHKVHKQCVSLLYKVRKLIQPDPRKTPQPPKCIKCGTEILNQDFVDPTKISGGKLDKLVAIQGDTIYLKLQEEYKSLLLVRALLAIENKEKRKAQLSQQQKFNSSANLLSTYGHLIIEKYCVTPEIKTESESKFKSEDENGLNEVQDDNDQVFNTSIVQLKLVNWKCNSKLIE